MKNLIEKRMVNNNIIIFNKYGGYIPLVTYKSYAEYFNKDLYLYLFDYDKSNYYYSGHINKLKNTDVNHTKYIVTTRLLNENEINELKGLKTYEKDFFKTIKPYAFNFYNINYDEEFIKFIESNSKENPVIGLGVVKVKKGDTFRIDEYDGAESVEFLDMDDWYTF